MWLRKSRAPWANPHLQACVIVSGWVFAVSYLKSPSNMCYGHKNVPFILSPDGDQYVFEI